MENQQLVSPSHRSVFGQGFFKAKNSVTTLKHLTYAPGLAAADFYFFPRLKSALKRRRFCDATDIIKNGTEELKRLSKNGFQKCFQHLHDR
jgi:hypothetical protein